MDVIGRIEELIEAVRLEHARDSRLAVFEVEVVEDDSGIAIIGATSEPAAAEELHRRVALIPGKVPIRDEVERLPAGDVAGSPYGLVRSAIAPFLASPLVSAAILTQAVSGQRVGVLRRAGRWLLCRADDGYLGWVHQGYLRACSEVEAMEWEVGSGGELCFSLGASVRDAGGAVLARLPWGARVVREKEGAVRLPAGSRGAIEGEIVAMTELAIRFPRDGGAVAETAAGWIAAPYLWGGVTPAGVDCSGLAQAVYRAHGVLLPRDSDLQSKFGEPVEATDDFAALLPGDLLFFAEGLHPVSHVAISRGGSRIVHASLGNGGVGCNDLLGESEFEEELRGLFVAARRVITPS
jgi:hypothetical protein